VQEIMLWKSKSKIYLKIIKNWSRKWIDSVNNKKEDWNNWQIIQEMLFKSLKIIYRWVRGY
jgi:hypothetical protein